MVSQCCRATSRLAPQGLVTVHATTTPVAMLPFSHRSLRRETRRFRTRFVTRAEEMDLDAAIGKLSEKFESAENKPVIVGYGVAALLVLFFAEWLIHLPALDVLLGFPVQLVGVLIAPLIVLRYVVEKEDWYADIENTLEKVASLLPGLKK